ncbi:GNAT family N-acetyltransferase [Nocardioides dilutus]
MSHVAYRPGSTRDRAALQSLLAGLSEDSAYARFQTALGAGPSPALVDALLPDGVRGGTLLAWDAERLVAHGVWVRLGPSRAAEVAVVVTDSHQRRGIGTELAHRLIATAGTRGIERIEVFSESRNRAVSRMVARQAPDAERERDGATVSYAFPVGGRTGGAWRAPVAWEVERREAWSA